MWEELIQEAIKYRPYSEALYPALAGDPFYRALESSVGAGLDAKSAMLAYYDYSIAEAARYGRISTGNDAGIGVSVWSLPLTGAAAAEKKERKVTVLRAQMGAGPLKVYERINASMAERTDTLVTQDDWYLSILGVIPACQGQGRGVELLSPVLEEADLAGVASYLETYTPRNMRFYERLGYRTLGELPEPVTGKPYWVMRREAQPVASANRR